MQHPTDTGMNKTGIDMSPIDVQKLYQGVKASKPTSSGDASTLASYRAGYLQDADPIGHVPFPGTLRGAANTGMQKIMAKNPEVFINKLGARMAFERTGTRLYDALLDKCRIRSDESHALPLDQLQQFREEESQHFKMVWNAIKDLGADPTAVTPEADIDSVASIGLMQILTDPRTSVEQSLHAILIAELADHDGWEILISLAQGLGHTKMADDFARALSEEGRHLATIREIMKSSCMSEAGLGST